MWQVLGFYAATLILVLAALSQPFHGAPKLDIIPLSLVSDGILYPIMGGSRPTSINAAASVILMLKNRLGYRGHRDKTSRSPTTWGVECDTTSVPTIRFRLA